MVRFLGFDVEKAAELGLKIEDLYLLRWVIRQHEHGKFKLSDIDKKFFRIPHAKLIHVCERFWRNSKNQVTLRMKRLAGIADNSLSDKSYPLIQAIYVIDGQRLSFYRINKSALAYITAPKRKHKPVVFEPLSDDFVRLYDKIVKIYDFKHHVDQQRPTNLMMESEKIIKSLRNGTFLASKEFDTDWLKKQDVSLLSGFTDAVLLGALQEYAKARSKDGWLAKSPYMSLPSFFFNPRTRKSMFIQMLQSMPATTLASAFDSSEESDMFYEELGWFTAKMNLPYAQCQSGFLDIYIFFKDHFGRLMGQAKRYGLEHEWVKSYRTTFKFKYFVSDLVEYMEKSTFAWGAHHIGMGGKFWWKFLAYIYKTRNGLRLSFDDSFYKKLEESNEEY